jgi:hypothetical protein
MIKWINILSIPKLASSLFQYLIDTKDNRQKNKERRHERKILRIKRKS